MTNSANGGTYDIVMVASPTHYDRYLAHAITEGLLEQIGNGFQLAMSMKRMANPKYGECTYRRWLTDGADKDV